MNSDLVDFANYLRRTHALAQPAKEGADTAASQAEGALRKLWDMTELSAGDFADKVCSFFKLPRATLQELLAAPPLVKPFSRRFLRATSVFPHEAAEGRPALAVADPSDLAAVRAAEIVLGGKIAVRVASFEDIATILDHRLGEEEAGPATQERAVAPREDDVENLRDLASGAPVVRALNDLFEKAVELRASDIHVEPFRTGLAIRLRVDGLLRAVPTPAGILPQALISRIKILAGLNIGERRLPQDGAARLRIARTDLDVRVAVMPTQHGEAAVIRLLPTDRGTLAVEKLGLSAADEATLQRLLRLPHGMIVVTGPTGSGKTTTLATMLAALNQPTRKILTIEDPVEYEIAGVNQSQAKPSIGLTFAAALRAFVRQDPDVIMVGEVRDAETAHISVHAALTGHLVLTSLHTETAAAAVPRLLDLGVEGFLLKSTLRAVIAQRLVGQLCDRCKIKRVLGADDIAADPRYAALGLRDGETIYAPGSCERCGGTGYRGRCGIFEVLEVTEPTRALIGPGADSGGIDRAAIRGGMTTMIDDGAAKCRSGVTSPAEVLRVATER